VLRQSRANIFLEKLDVPGLLAWICWGVPRGVRCFPGDACLLIRLLRYRFLRYLQSQGLVSFSSWLLLLGRTAEERWTREPTDSVGGDDPRQCRYYANNPDPRCNVNDLGNTRGRHDTFQFEAY
jgi:hypothetical protein